MSLFDNLLINDHNIELFNRLNGSAIKVNNQYDATLLCSIYQAYGSWIVSMVGTFIKDEHIMPPHLEGYDFEGNKVDRIAVPLSAHNIYIDGVCLQDMVVENTS